MHMDLEETKTSFSRWKNKQTVVYPENEILFSTKSKWDIKPWKHEGSLNMHITKWKKLIRKGYILYNSNYMTFQKK